MAPALWALLACVFAARLFAMPGFMPGRAADGAITLQICSPTGHTPTTLAIPVEGQDEREPGEQQHCPFMLGGHLAGPDELPLLADAPRAALPQISVNPARFSIGTYAPLPPATGPPAHTA